jgi:hypothetical protein
MGITKLNLNGTTYNIGSDLDPSVYEGRELSEYSWADLKQKCTDNDFSGIRVGDYKTITVGSSGESTKARIAGIDTYYNTGSYAPTNTSENKIVTHHIDFICDNTYNLSVMWNTENLNYSTSNSVPYMVSNVYTYLNNDMYTDIIKYNSELEDSITNKIMRLETRSYSSAVNIVPTNSTGSLVKEMGKFWLPSEYEIFGYSFYGTQGYSALGAMQYPLFRNCGKYKIKGISGGAARVNWWLSTACRDSSASCCCVSQHGSAIANGATSLYYVPICFRIAA